MKGRAFAARGAACSHMNARYMQRQGVVRPTFDLTTGVLPAGLTFTRASTATVQTGTTAVTTGVAVDVARFGKLLDADTVGLLIEESRTQLHSNPRAMTGTGWTAGSGGTPTANDAVGPDDTLNADRYQSTSGQYSNYFTRAGTDGYVQVSLWSRAKTAPFTSTTQLGSANYNLSLTTAWARFSREYNSTGASYYVTPQNAGGAVSQDALWDMYQIEAGRFATSWIASGTRSADRVVCTMQLDDNGRASLEYVLRPLGSSTQYTADAYLLYVDANNYVLWSKTTYKLTFRVGGTSYTPAVTVDWSAGDTLKVWLEVGGSLPTISAYKRNSDVGQIVTTGTGDSLGTLTLTSTEILGNNGSNVLSCWLTSLRAYSRGQRPAWVTAVVGEWPGEAVTAFGGSWQAFAASVAYTWGNRYDIDHGTYRDFDECAMNVFETDSSVIRVTGYEVATVTDLEYGAAGIVVGDVGAVYGTRPVSRVNSTGGSSGSRVTEYVLPSGTKRVFVIGSSLSGVAGQLVQSVSFDALATTTRITEPSTRSVCFAATGGARLSHDGYVASGGVLSSSGPNIALRSLFCTNLARANPLVVYFCRGTNDLSAGVLSTDFAVALQAWITDVLATLPGVTIVLQSITRRPALEGTTAPGFRTVTSDAATANSLTYVNGLAIFDAADISTDLVHPVMQSAYKQANAVLANTSATLRLLVYGDSIVSGSTLPGSWACVLGVPGLIRIGRI